MNSIDLNSLELREIASALDPQRQLEVTFPHSSGTGAASTATVYFELEPGRHVGMHRDSAEEVLLILDGDAEATVGDERAVASSGTMVTVPALAPHNVLNVGTTTLRVLGFFSASTVVATFDVPAVPGGPQVFVIGAPIPIAEPLEAAVPA